MTIEDLAITSTGHVHILHMAYVFAMPIVESTTVQQARAWLEERMPIDPRCIAVLDGDEVGEATTVREGQYLCFVRRSGEMGP